MENAEKVVFKYHKLSDTNARDGRISRQDSKETPSSYMTAQSCGGGRREHAWSRTRLFQHSVDAEDPQNTQTSNTV